ncbi:hypothetical protein ACFQ3P_15135 [Paraburkholderia sabiae]|uniref:Uncharacterized protein n=1 Tax=Paraburkholderia sabiae TaxID=273251 RepID=A0ABU9Q7X9_9BURK|nr:hypothetical protein [Paraburkholderia sabiae]WJZ77837.1 hypothetical protein QEN71_37990 [Paraburkholderia sabiae]
MDDFFGAFVRPKHSLEFLQEPLVTGKPVALRIRACFDQKPRLGWLKGERRYGAICYVFPSTRSYFGFGVYRYEAKTGCHRHLPINGCISAT